MTLAFWFWLILFLLVLFSLTRFHKPWADLSWTGGIGWLLLILALIVLGWRALGSPVTGG